MSNVSTAELPLLEKEKERAATLGITAAGHVDKKDTLRTAIKEAEEKGEDVEFRR
jgi:hypothetical protein